MRVQIRYNGIGINGIENTETASAYQHKHIRDFYSTKLYCKVYCHFFIKIINK